MSAKQTNYDVIVLGGGAAGLMCALTAGQRGKRVLVIEVSNKLGKKILMSGGGRCNFTNLDVQAEHFICANPHFVKSALSQYTQWDFIALMDQHSVNYHEKSQGQLFCDHSAKDVLNVLLAECREGNVAFEHDCEVSSVSKTDGFTVETNNGDYQADNLVVATGGLSIPTLGGATGLGYRIAQQFDLTVNPTEASLVPFTLTGQWQVISESLSGVSLPVLASVPEKGFSENLLFTHRGLSGPAILQLSNYWRLGEVVSINLLPKLNLAIELKTMKRSDPNRRLVACLSAYLPKSVTAVVVQYWWPAKLEKPLQSFSDADLEGIAHQFHNWVITPSGTEGYRTAEVTRGGVDVSEISSKTMQVNTEQGLYFIGEVLDVTGHLGGYNFQWAWSTGYVAGMND